jgi:hypothetical protein
MIRINRLTILLAACLLAGGDVPVDGREYMGAEWETLRFRTRWANRRNSPVFVFPRCVIMAEGTLVLDMRTVRTIWVQDDQGTRMIGEKPVRPRAPSQLWVDMKIYDSVVILNGDDYTVVGMERSISRIDPYGAWLIR